MLVTKGRLDLDTTILALRAATLAAGIREVPLDGEIAIAASELADHQRPVRA